MIVFPGSQHDPRVVLVPVKFGDTICEAAVHEQTKGNVVSMILVPDI